MERYVNLGGDSGVVGYEIGADFIWVHFSKYKYQYTYASAGPDNIEHMKELAKRGRGLNAFVIKNVRKKYAQKVLRRAT